MLRQSLRPDSSFKKSDWPESPTDDFLIRFCGENLLLYQELQFDRLGISLVRVVESEGLGTALAICTKDSVWILPERSFDISSPRHFEIEFYVQQVSTLISTSEAPEMDRSFASEVGLLTLSIAIWQESAKCNVLVSHPDSSPQLTASEIHAIDSLLSSKVGIDRLSGIDVRVEGSVALISGLVLDSHRRLTLVTLMLRKNTLALDRVDTLGIVGAPCVSL